MKTCYLLLGSNIEPREKYLYNAVSAIEEKLLLKLCSGIYETEAWQMAAGTNSFLNTVVKVETDMSALELLEFTQQVERLAKRGDKKKNTSRTLDLDILLYGDEVIETPQLSIPHPLMHLRRFTLVPLCEIAANVIHPTLHQAIGELLNQCTDICEVRPYAATI